MLRVAVGIDADERIQNAMALLEGEEHNDMSSDPSDAECTAAVAAGAAIVRDYLEGAYLPIDSYSGTPAPGFFDDRAPAFALPGSR